MAEIKPPRVNSSGSNHHNGPGPSRIDRHFSITDASPRKHKHFGRRHGTWTASDFRSHGYRRGGRHFSGRSMCGILMNNDESAPRFPSDPLGLEGLLHDESLNRLANMTPLTSPMVTPAHKNEQVEVVIPSNITDPLHLDADIMNESGNTSDENNSLSGHDGPGSKRKRKHNSGRNRNRNKRRKTRSESQDVKAEAAQKDPSPVKAPSVGPSGAKALTTPTTPTAPKKWKPVFKYGNYNRYYGRRNANGSVDVRLKFLKPEWFAGKRCLDIGCNIGHVTYTIASQHGPIRMVGIDIDEKLITIARKNLKHYVKAPSDASCAEADFPTCMKILYGAFKPPLPIPCGVFSGSPTGEEEFPYNVGFVAGNYVGPNDEVLEATRPEYDAILCLSVTKWVHLNFGDEGLMRLFKRAFRNLRPGGKFILEPQPWASYAKSKKLTPEIFETYKTVKLRPQQFPDILLGEVGFKKMEFVGCPRHEQKGFQRPIQIYYKRESSGTKPRTSVSWSLSAEQERKSLGDTADEPNVKSSAPPEGFPAPAVKACGEERIECPPALPQEERIEQAVNENISPSEEAVGENSVIGDPIAEETRSDMSEPGG